MSLWLVKLEFVPLEGAAGRSDEELDAIAAAFRSKFADYAAAAHGRGNRFVASAKMEAESPQEAESWGRAVLFDMIDDVLPDWRLERLDVWAA